MTNSVRIIGGRFRGKKINFPNIPGLRPTPDRVRETLFNWLAPYLRNSHCLDLFAGSGVLGLEALSRGAQFVQFVDNSAKVVKDLSTIISDLHLAAQVTLSDCHQPIPIPAKPFNIIFLDPPYQSNLLISCYQWLVKPGYLADKALIYIESQQELDPLSLPNDWTITHIKKAGMVHYHLLRKS